MTFYPFQSRMQGAYFVILIISIVLSIPAIILRFAATRITRRKVALEDWFALSAVLVFLARIGIALYALTIINGRGIELAFDKKAFKQAFKIIYTAEIATSIDQTLAKYSIMALYYRIFRVNRTFVRWIWAMAVFQTLASAVMVFTQAFQCNPVHKLWQWWTPGKCLELRTIMVAVEPPNSVVDFALVILAMFMIQSLHIARATKWKLAVLFGLGSFAGIFGFIKIGVAYSPDLSYSVPALGFWAVVQSLATIVCCCAPVYKPLLPESGIWSRLTSKLSMYSLRGRQASASEVSRRDTGNKSSGDETGSQRSQRWLRLDKSSSQGRVWAEYQTESDNQEQSSNNLAMGTIKVNKSVVVA